MMQINSADIAVLADYLESEFVSGSLWISYNTSEIMFNRKCIETFQDKDLALEYCFNNHSDLDYFTVIPLKPIMESVRNLKEAGFSSETMDRDISISFDVSAIVANYNIIKTLKTTKMTEEENLIALEKQFQYSGMGDISRDKLIKNIADHEEKFSIELNQQIGKVLATARPNFTLSKEGNYFANDYDMTVKPEGKEAYTRNFKFRRPNPIYAKNEAGEDRTEWINSTITFKEAFNQMMGRAVNKDYVHVNEEHPENNRKYNAWEYIDFKNPDEKGNWPGVKVYNYNIEKHLREHPLSENLDKVAFNRLVDSLKRGNIQIANYIKEDGTTEKIYFEADPKHDNVKKYDMDMKPILLSIKRQQNAPETPKLAEGSESKEQHQGQDKKQSENVGIVDEEGEKAEKKGKRKSKGIS